MELSSDMFPWQVYASVVVRSLLNPAAMIVAGITGWLAGAGPKSTIAGLLFVILSPIVWTFVLYQLAVSYIVALADIIAAKEISLLAAAYVGTLISMLIIFFIFRRGRHGWRDRYSLKVEADQ